MTPPMAHRYRARPHGRHYRRCAITGKLRERLVLKLSVALRGGTRGYCYGVHGSTSPPSSDVTDLPCCLCNSYRLSTCQSA
ncbi:unnamed protein product [Tilletia controversa]|nr:unnamed protein product [Tilletia controversa]